MNALMQPVGPNIRQASTWQEAVIKRFWESLFWKGTGEIWHYPDGVILPEQEGKPVRICYRFSTTDFKLENAQPIVTEKWVRYDPESEAWTECAPREDLLDISGEGHRNTNLITFDDKGFLFMTSGPGCPINRRFILYNREEKVPHFPLEPADDTGCL